MWVVFRSFITNLGSYFKKILRQNLHTMRYTGLNCSVHMDFDKCLYLCKHQPKKDRNHFHRSRKFPGLGIIF